MADTAENNPLFAGIIDEPDSKDKHDMDIFLDDDIENQKLSEQPAKDASIDLEDALGGKSESKSTDESKK